MARQIHLEHSDPARHITSRGNERRDIFADNDDRTRFLELPAETVGWASRLKD